MSKEISIKLEGLDDKSAYFWSVFFSGLEHWSKSEVAREIGISKPTLMTRIENGGWKDKEVKEIERMLKENGLIDE